MSTTTAALTIPDAGPATLANDATLYRMPGSDEFLLARAGEVVTTFSYAYPDKLDHLVTPGTPPEHLEVPERWIPPCANLRMPSTTPLSRDLGAPACDRRTA